jgi:hypothetical protein
VQVVEQEDGAPTSQGVLIPREISQVFQSSVLNGKHAKATFPSSEHRSRGILDIVHLDVCGPMSIASITESVYYVSFINDLSRKNWIYFLKTKDEIFNRF